MKAIKKLKDSAIVLLLVVVVLMSFSCSKESLDVEVDKPQIELDPAKWKFPEYKGVKDVKGDTEIVYPIVKGKLGQPYFIGDNDKTNFTNLFKIKEEHLKAWKFYASILPLKSYDGLWTELHFMEKGSGGSAGPIDEKDPKHFSMVLPSVKFYPNIYTLIHEFGHILTLNNKQLDFNVKKADCKTYKIYNGCFKEGSYGAQFYKDYYSGQVFEAEYLAMRSDPNTDLYHPDSQVKIKTLYNKYKDYFYDDYCVVDLSEDLAVTFERFVSWPKPTDASKIKNKKILHYYNDAAMAKLRKDILKNIEAAKKIYGDF